MNNKDRNISTDQVTADKLTQLEAKLHGKYISEREDIYDNEKAMLITMGCETSSVKETVGSLQQHPRYVDV